MTTPAPSNFAQWVLPSPTGIDALQYQPNACLSGPLNPNQVEVALHATTLNYRDLPVIKGLLPPSFSPHGTAPNLIPTSDASATVLASTSPHFTPGDAVLAHMTPHLPPTALPRTPDVGLGLGHASHGALRQIGRFSAETLVRAPRGVGAEGGMGWGEAAALGCAGLTAWNALFGGGGSAMREGDWVLVLGSGGVSVAAAALAKAAGGRVAGTSAGGEGGWKGRKMLGKGLVEGVVDYVAVPEWGRVARERFTPDGRGFDYVIDVGGDRTLGQGLEAVRTGGTVVLAGALGGGTEAPVPMMALLGRACTVRGVLLGSRVMFEEMVRFVEEKRVRFPMDEVEFGMEEAKEAFGRLERQEHFNKVVINLRK